MVHSTVSVVIPCYNGASVIDRSIKSVYMQDYPSIELIVVDDGSTDNSKNAILAWESNFAQKGYSLKYVFQENRGLGGAIDTGLKYVTGEYLTLLDADDYYLPGSVSRRAQFLNRHPDCAGVRTNGWMIKGKNRQLFVTSQKDKETTDLFYALFFDGVANWAGSYMVRTEILFEFYSDRNIYPSRFGQNMQIILPVAYKRKFGFIDEPLMAYVLHENSLSQAPSADEQCEKDNLNFYGYQDIYRHMIQSIIHDPEERAFYENRINSWLYRHECDRAVRTHDKQGLKNYFDALVSTGYATLNDIIAYNSVLNPAKALAYRIVRRLKRGG